MIAFLICVAGRKHGGIAAAGAAIGGIPITTTGNQTPPEQAEFRPPAGFAIFRFFRITNECGGIEPRGFGRQRLQHHLPFEMQRANTLAKCCDAFLRETFRPGADACGIHDGKREAPVAAQKRILMLRIAIEAFLTMRRAHE